MIISQVAGSKVIKRYKNKTSVRIIFMVNYFYPISKLNYTSSLSMTALAEKLLLLPDVSSFETYQKNFPLKGDKLFEKIYEQNKASIKIKKRHVATANLKRIFEATFKLSSQIGFDAMSLRDLAQTTGVSMGSIYSCISKKENITVIVKNLVNEVSEQYMLIGRMESDAWSRLETTIRLQFYNSCILQSWLFFLYFETRGLPKNHQHDSKQIELNSIANYKSIIESGIKDGIFSTQQADFIAHNILVLIQDWYLKPWKSKIQGVERDKYLDDILELIRTSLSVNCTVHN